MARPCPMMRMLALCLLAVSHVPARAASFPEPTVPATCGMQLKGACGTTADLDRLKALGVTVVRYGFHWEGIEKSKGVYEYGDYDRFVREAGERGLRVLGCIAFANKLYGPVREDEGRDAYARFAAALAGHYKADAVLWEIWNEPNTMTFWGKHGGKGNSDQYAGEYVALVKATVPAMRRADPGCTIVAGAVSGLWAESFKWTEACFAKGVLQSGIDGWSVHPYSPTYPEDYPEAYAKVRAMMEQHGAAKDFPLLDSERGFPVTAKAEGATGGDPGLVRQHQAWHLVRQCVMDLSCGLKLTNWYEWKGKEFGIADPEGANPAFIAYRVMIEQLRGYRYERRLPTDSPLDYVMSFTSATGGLKLVAWTSPPPKAGPDQAQPHALAIPVDATGSLAVVRMDGTAATCVVAGGAATVDVSGAPLYLTVRPGR